MEFRPLSDCEFYNDCESVARSLGFAILELKIVRSRLSKRVLMSILKADGGDVSVDECAKVHRILQERLQILLDDDDIYMEVSSPGAERNVKNAAEFPLFKGRNARIWLADGAEWVCGKILCCDEKALSLEIGGDEKIFALENIAKAKLC